jgi:hypothetical protein
MREDQQKFLGLLGQLPARLTAEQAAWVLNCQPHDVPALMAAKLLKPLGNPPPNGIKFFATADILELTKDRNWLVRMSATIYQHWQKKNARNKDLAVQSPAFSPGEKPRVSDPASASA